jgi:glycosyltransferase involved in cell wall biosynthesis
MRLIFGLDHRFVKGEDGHVYSPGQFSCESWDIPLQYFDEIVIYSRWVAADESRSGFSRCDRSRVRFRWMPNLSTPRGLLVGRTLVREVARELRSDDVVVASLPSNVGLLLAEAGRIAGTPVVAEVVACVWDGLFNHGRFLARFYAPIGYWRNRRAIARASLVRYVTRSFLQTRYPTRSPSIALSDAQIVRRDVDEVLRKLDRSGRDHLACAFVGPLFHRSKGLDLAFRAIRVAQDLGARVRLSVAGPGEQDSWRRLAEGLGIGERVTFEGVLQRGEGVRRFLDRHDLLLLPSRQEGLSRIALEAMARGLPVLASTAGGNPEIVPPHNLHRTGDFTELGRRIFELDRDRVALEKCSLEALSRVEPFLLERLEPRWKAYYGLLAELGRRRIRRDLGACGGQAVPGSTTSTRERGYDSVHDGVMP